MEKKVKRFFFVCAVLLAGMFVLFSACGNNDAEPNGVKKCKCPNGTIHTDAPCTCKASNCTCTYASHWWTFQDPIPGWKVFVDASGQTGDYPDNPNGTTMKLDAELPNGMTLLASGRSTRWDPTAPAPEGSGFTDGYIQPNGATAAGVYAFKIEDVQGPFKITINYTSRDTSANLGYPIIVIDGEEVKRGDGVAGFSPKSVSYDYIYNDTALIQVAVGGWGIKIFDVIIFPKKGGKEPPYKFIPVENIAGVPTLITPEVAVPLNGIVKPSKATNKTIAWNVKSGSANFSNGNVLTVSAAAGTNVVVTATIADGKAEGEAFTQDFTIKSINSPWILVPAFQTEKAFPGAEGYGQMASGGRGGKVVAVTNLEDNATNPPTGSLRWALAQYPGEPLTVVFRVSGLIELKSQLRVSRNNYTLAGHTAPGDGICIMGNKVNLNGSNNLIIRHLRFRVGDMNGDPNGAGSIGIENSSNFIIDHCTFGWSGEENTTIYDNKLSTVQWCIIHEGLYNSGHNKGERGYGTQWGGETATYHHNLLAHNYSRSPRLNGARANDRDVMIDFVNNVNYNWGKNNSAYGAEIETNSHRVNFVNNYYKPGPAFPGTNRSYFVEVYYGVGQGKKIAYWYMDGNFMEGSANTDRNADNYSGLLLKQPSITIDDVKVDRFEVPYPVTTQTAENAYNDVLYGAGAFPRDSVDARIVNEVRTGTAAYSGSSKIPGMIDKPADVVGGYPTYNSTKPPVDTDGDGIPDDWETENGLNPYDPADGAETSLTNTYSNLEVYLFDLLDQ